MILGSDPYFCLPCPIAQHGDGGELAVSSEGTRVRPLKALTPKVEK